jgi:hypothetical protein
MPVMCLVAPHPRLGGGFYGPARGGEFRRTAPSGLGKCTNTPLGDGVVLHAEASPRPTIVLDDDLRSVVSVSVQRTKVSSFDPHLMSV